MAGLFSTFNVGKSGLGVSQTTIDVTSHNISNSNTVGYTRQRAKIVANSPLSTPTSNVGQLGTGAQVESIERIRNTFLDYQVRGQNSILGSADVRSQSLSQIEDIFGEPSDTGISAMMGEFFDAWQELSKQPNSSNARTVLTQQTLAMTDAINSAYTKLEELEKNSQALLKQNATDVNTLLERLDSLNKQIVSITTTGQSPNDLLDSRDTLLDELSYKFNISIDTKSYNGIDIKTSSDNMANGTLVSASGTDSKRLSYITSVEQDPREPDVHVITYYKLGDTTSEDNKQTVRVSGLSEDDVKNLTASRLLWADSEGQLVRADGYPIKNGATIDANELMDFTPVDGEVGGNISVQQDITTFKSHLDSLAKAIAFSINTVHSGMQDAINNGGNPNYDAVPFFVNSDIAKYDSNGNITNIDEVLNAEGSITAKNLTINKEILNDVMKIKTKTHDSDFSYTSENGIDAEGDGARALAIASLRTSLIRIQDFGVNINSRSDMFKDGKGGCTLTNYGMTISGDTSGMSFDSYYQDAIDKLGVQASAANNTVTNVETMVNSLESSRDSVSGVSLDEEMANLIQYQHAYSANAKVISTVGELLDVIINGLIN